MIGFDKEVGINRQAERFRRQRKQKLNCQL